MKVDKTRTTLNARRFKENPLEKKFVEAWREKCNLAQGPTDSGPNKQLEAMLSPNQPEMAQISDRDEQVAETVIQWLGSPVGQEFLREVLNLPYDMWQQQIQMLVKS